MTLSKGSSDSARRTKKAKTGKRLHIEFSITQCFLFFFSLFFVLAWMFVFGILVGRGLPLVESQDTSLRAQILRFMGLGRETSPPPENVAETWENPQKMLESLNYYESFTNGTDPISGAPRDNSLASPSEPKRETTKHQPTSPQTKSSEQASTKQEIPSDLQDSGHREDVREDAAAESVTEHFTLLAASVRDSNNAENFAKKLKTKGYTPRLETVDMPESGRWTRVLVGSFDSREEALKFAAEFNRKENMQGLVIRVGR